jgi:hypothetical protein
MKTNFLLITLALAALPSLSIAAEEVTLETEWPQCKVWEWCVHKSKKAKTSEEAREMIESCTRAEVMVVIQAFQNRQVCAKTPSRGN